MYDLPRCLSIFFLHNDLRRSARPVTTADIQSNRYRFFSVAAIGTFMATLDGSILNIALPTIAADLNVRIDQVAWVALAYSLTLVSLIMIYGAWAQKKGYYFSYRLGYVLFITGSVICSFAHSLELLIAGRAIQSSGTAMFAALGPGLVSDVFPGEQRGKGIGLMVMMVAAGFTVGPPLGGVLLSIFGWQSIFLINVPIGIVGLTLVFRWFKVLPVRAPEREVHLAGAVMLSLGLVTGIFGLSLISDYAPTDWRVLTCLAIAAVFMVTFFVLESRPKTALIGFQIFRNRQFVSSVSAMLLSFIALAGIMILVPFYLEHVMGLVPKQVWRFLIIIPIAMLVMAPLSGRWSDKIGFRLLTTLGMSMTSVGIYLFSNLDVNSTDSYIVLCLAALGVGVGIFNTPNSSALMGSVAPEQRAITSGIMATTRNIGMSVGVALSTALFAYFQGLYEGMGTENEIFVMAYHNVIYVAIGVAALAIPICLTRANRQPDSGDKPSQEGMAAG